MCFKFRLHVNSGNPNAQVTPGSPGSVIIILDMGIQPNARPVKAITINTIFPRYITTRYSYITLYPKVYFSQKIAFTLEVKYTKKTSNYIRNKHNYVNSILSNSKNITSAM